MKPGQIVFIKAQVLRIDGEKIHAQTYDGQLIRTDVSNVENKALKSVPEDKSVKDAPENKSK